MLSVCSPVLNVALTPKPHRVAPASSAPPQAPPKALAAGSAGLMPNLGSGHTVTVMLSSGRPSFAVERKTKGKKRVLYWSLVRKPSIDIALYKNFRCLVPL